MTGAFEKYELIHGSFGEQYTTIGGVRYLAWFDLMDPALKGLRAGAVVDYEVQPGPTVLCNMPHVESGLAWARLVRVVGQPEEAI